MGPRLFLYVLALRPYFTGGVLNALAWAQEQLKIPTPSTHRLGRGLRGYLIPFAPHAFVSERQYNPSILPSLLAFHRGSTDFTPTHDIPDASD